MSALLSVCTEMRQLFDTLYHKRLQETMSLLKSNWGYIGCLRSWSVWPTRVVHIRNIVWLTLLADLSLVLIFLRIGGKYNLPLITPVFTCENIPTVVQNRAAERVPTVVFFA